MFSDTIGYRTTVLEEEKIYLQITSPNGSADGNSNKKKENESVYLKPKNIEYKEYKVNHES